LNAPLLVGTKLCVYTTALGVKVVVTDAAAVGVGVKGVVCDGLKSLNDDPLAFMLNEVLAGGWDT